MSETDSHRSIARSASHFFTGTFISRLTGMVRDIFMAFYFGATPAVAAFLVAFRLSNILRRLLGEGALLNGFIPFFERKRSENRMLGAIFFRDLFWSLTLILLSTILILEIILYSITKLCSLSDGAFSIFFMTMIMLPGLLFICLFGLSAALLECEKNFFIPGIAPVAFNIIWIIAIYLFKDYQPSQGMIRISIFIVFAFFLQWCVTMKWVVLYLKKFISVGEWFTFRLFTKELREIAMPLLLGVIGIAAVQINSAVDIIISRLASLEGPAYLNYAGRLYQLPLALFGIAISSALMPPLSRAIKNEDNDRYKSLLSFAFDRVFSLLFPITISIFIIGGVSVNLLYGRGEFNAISIVNTTCCLFGYAIGLVPSAFTLILATAFYAKNDFLTPTIASLLSVFLNIFLNLLMVFVFKFSVSSIAISTAVTAIFNMYFLWKKIGEPIFGSSIYFFLKVVVASFVAGLFTFLAGRSLLDEPILDLLIGNFNVTPQKGLLVQGCHFAILSILFTSTFLLLSYLMKIDHILEFFGLKKSDDLV